MAILGTVLSLSGGPEKKPASDREAAAAEKLVRLDLLSGRPRPDVRVRRNIFVLGPTAGENIPSSGARLEGPEPGRRPATGPESPSAEPAVEVSYIGFVAAATKTIGLLFVNGQVLAVGEGDALAGGYTVLKVGPTAIELLGPGGEIRTVPIDGERR